MKSKKVNKKLELKKETISILSNVELTTAKGGIWTQPFTCTRPPYCNKN